MPFNNRYLPQLGSTPWWSLSVLALGLSALLFTTSCSRSVSGARPRHPPQVLVHDREENVDRIVATFETRSEPSLPLTVTTLNAAQSLYSVFFLNETTGWIGGAGGLYQTTDSGVRWERSDLEMQDGARVVKVFFANSQLGLVVAERNTGNDEDAGLHNHLWVYRTTDGGKMWQVQLDLDNSAISSIRFLNNDEGWITGSTFSNPNPWREFILHTSDRGEHWQDISAALNESLADYRRNNNYVRGGFTDVLPEGPLAATVLMPEGRMYRTIDNGQNWQTISGPVIDTSISHMWLEHVGSKDDDLWIAGSVLGRWRTSMFATRKGNLWTEYGMAGIGFSDVVVLPGSRIVASGSLDLDEPEPREGGLAVLSYSPDGGKRWEILYKNPQAQAINAVTAADPNNVWAVGDRGLILHVRPPNIIARN
jgi:photosystem II stability/assembly factor-like uncharacterized protein